MVELIGIEAFGCGGRFATGSREFQEEGPKSGEASFGDVPSHFGWAAKRPAQMVELIGIEPTTS